MMGWLFMTWGPPVSIVVALITSYFLHHHRPANRLLGPCYVCREAGKSTVALLASLTVCRDCDREIKGEIDGAFAPWDKLRRRRLAAPAVPQNRSRLPAPGQRAAAFKTGSARKL